MKKVIFLALALILTASSQGQQPFSAKQQKIQESVVKIFQALSERDTMALKRYCTPDVTFYEYGQVWNIDTLIRKAILLNQSANFERINHFEFLQTEATGHTAWVTYRLRSTIRKDASTTTFNWLETVVLSRSKKNWLVKHLHSTLLSRN